MALVTINNPAGDKFVRYVLNGADLTNLTFDVHATKKNGINIPKLIDTDSDITYLHPISTAIASDGSFTLQIVSTETVNGIDENGEVLQVNGTSIDIFYKLSIRKVRKILFSFIVQVPSSPATVTLEDLVTSGAATVPSSPIFGAFTTTFDSLTDTPASKTTNSGKYPRVNVGETAIVYDNVNYETSLADSLPMPNAVGGIPAGTLVSALEGKTVQSMFDDLLFPTVLASITTPKSVSLAVSGTTGNVELGTLLSNNLTATFNVGVITDGDGITTHDLVGAATLYTFTGTGISSTPQAGNVLGISVNAVLGSNNWAVTTDHAIGTDPYFDNKGNAGTNLDASRVAGSTSDPTSSPNITGYYAFFYGVGGATPTNSAEVRALTIELDVDNSFILNTGNVETKFKIILPPSRTISSVIDLTALSADITSSYVLLGTISVNDAGGNPHTYNQYEMNIGVPYTVNHQHSFTFA